MGEMLESYSGLAALKHIYHYGRPRFRYIYAMVATIVRNASSSSCEHFGISLVVPS
jgi:hypothetical protein